MDKLRYLLMCVCLAFPIFSGVAHAELVVIGGIGTIVDRSLILVETAAPNGKIGFIVWAPHHKLQPIAQITCEDNWDGPKAQWAALFLAKHINTNTEINFVRALTEAGLSKCQQQNVQ